MREAALEKKIKARIEKEGGLCFKWVSPGFTGVPDRIAILPAGRLAFIEVKRPGLKDGRTPRQKRVAQMLEARGQTVLRVSSMETLEEWLREEVIT